MAKIVLTLRVTAEKRAAWQACADRAGSKSLSSWIEGRYDANTAYGGWCCNDVWSYVKGATLDAWARRKSNG